MKIPLARIKRIPTRTTENSKNTTRNENFTKSFTNTDEYTEHHFGKQPGASFSKMLSEFRETFMNIDMMVIDNLSDLFMNVW